jgi:two-component system sensor histidine kinase GlrK
VTVAGRIATSAALLILLLVAALSYHLSVVRRLAASNRALSTNQVQLIVLALEQMRQLERIDESARKLAVTGDPGYGGQLAERAAAFEGSLRRLASFEAGGGERQAIERLKGEWRGFVGALPPPGELPREATPAERARRLGPALARVAVLRRSAQDLVEAANQELTRQGERAEQARRASERIALAVFALALAAGGTAVVLAIRAIQRPLHRLIAATSQIAEQNYDVQLRLQGDDEFARLAAAFDDMARRLAELDEMKRNLLSHVSHELQTPLANIQESHLLLLDGLSGPLTAEQRHLLELNVASCRRLARLISNLLERSKLDAGMIACDFAEHDLREVAQAVIAELAGRAEEAGQLLATALPERPLWIVCDREKIFQVLHNLVDNALKYSTAGGRVELRARGLETMLAALPAELRTELPERWQETASRDTAWTLLEVADEGSGVPPEDRERIFERFYRSQLRRGGPSGVGLGLAICRDLVVAHGGAIWVSANAPVGSVFHVLFPAARAQPQLVAAGGAALGARG